MSAGNELPCVRTSRVDLRNLPENAPRALGFNLQRLQQGEQPRDWKPMIAVGAGVIEIRVRAGGAFLLLSGAKFMAGLYVLPVLEKKSRKTSPLDLALGRARLAAVKRSRGER